MKAWRLGSSPVRRRELRHDQTDAERILWWHIGAQQLGVKFRRQHPLGAYILDFYCPIVKLAIELDGDGHASVERAAYDKRRTQALEARGLRVMRFSNQQVLSECDLVLEEILRTLTLPSPAVAGEGSN